MMSGEVRSHTPRSWANIPLDLLLRIAKRLDITATIRLSAMRTSWASTILPHCSSIPPFRADQPIPWLLISPQKSKTDPNSTDLTFYDLITTTSYSVPVSIPSLCSHHWWSSNKGWIVTVDQQSQLHLIKPLTGAHLLLPSSGTGRERPWKVILCRTPDCTDGFLAISLNGHGRLVYAKPGAESWISLSNFCPFLDAVFYKGKVYAIASDTLSCWDLRGSSLRHDWIINIRLNKKIRWWTRYLGKRRHSRYFQPWTKYLVEWRGELLMVFSNKEPWTRLENHKFGNVKLYKFDLQDHDRRWSRVRSLGGDALFLGANYSYAVSTRAVGNVCRNCIYITDQLWHCFPHFNNFRSKCAFGVYDLKKKTYKPCYPSDLPSYLMPPIWFWPC